MEISILLAGQYRGDNQMISLHKKYVGNYDTYVACLPKYFEEWKNSDWNLIELYDVPMVNFNDTLWAKHRNSPADESGFWQFWNLKYVLQNVPKKYDFYIKSRNDLVIESELNIDFNNLKENTYYYSERSFNGVWEHMNDQFWIGSKNVVDVISKFVDEFYSDERAASISACNEHMLKAWLEWHDVKIEKFSNFYYSKNHNGITQSSGEINKFFLE